jgi:hypothetical protein
MVIKLSIGHEIEIPSDLVFAMSISSEKESTLELAYYMVRK